MYYIEVDGRPECCSGLMSKMTKLLLLTHRNIQNEVEFAMYADAAGLCSYTTKHDAEAAVACIKKYAERVGVKEVRAVEGTCPEYAGMLADQANRLEEHDGEF